MELGLTTFVTAPHAAPSSRGELPQRHVATVRRSALRRHALLLACVLLTIGLLLAIGLLVVRPLVHPALCGDAMLQAQDGTCVQCLQNSDCASRACSATGICVQCMSNSNCAAGTVCVYGTCVPACVSGDQCGVGYVCNAAGGCVQCVTSADCGAVTVAAGTASAPVICNVVSNRCVQCGASGTSPCPAGFKCSIATGLCVLGCDAASQCPDDTVCSSSTGMCAVCGGNDDCPVDAPTCTPHGCVVCSNAGGCTAVSTPICVNGSCVALLSESGGVQVLISVAEGNYFGAVFSPEGLPSFSFGSTATPFVLIPDAGNSGAWALVVASSAIAVVSQLVLPPSSATLQTVPLLTVPPPLFNVFVSVSGNPINVTTASALKAPSAIVGAALTFGDPHGVTAALMQIGGGNDVVSLVSSAPYPLTMSFV